MRRFNYDENDGYRDDVDKFFSEEKNKKEPGISEEEYKSMMDEEQVIQEMEIGFIHRDLNHRMLRTCIRTCEKSIWWWFCSHVTKLKMIDAVYKQFRKLEEETFD
jgi:hypothetical protein